MTMTKIIKAAGMSAALVSSASALSEGQALVFPKVNAEVPYDAVTALPFAPAHKRVEYGADPLQFGLFWRANPAPKKTNETQTGNAKPLIVFIHGGCWLSEYDIVHSYPLTSALAQAGYSVFSLEYRRTGDVGGGWPGSYQDILKGIEAAYKVAKEEAQTEELVLVGHSAGGHLAVLAGQNVPVTGVVGLAAITDVEKYAKGSNSCETATPAFMGGTPEQVAEAYAQASPAKHDVTVKTLLLHGDKDAIVALEHATLSGAVSVIEEGAGHFDWVHPGSPAFSQLLNALAQFD